MDPRTNRFCNWSRESGYYPRQGVRQSTFQTDQQANSYFDNDNTLKSYTIVKQQREANKNQVVRANKSPTSSTASLDGSSSGLMKQTVQMQTFIDQKSWVHAIQDARDEEPWKAQFDQLNCSGSAFEVAIPVTEMKTVVYNVLGRDCPHFIVDKFDKVASEVCKARQVNWDDFRLQIPRLAAAVAAECTQKAETPGLVKLMNRPRLVDKNMGPLGDISTVYRDTIVYRTTNESTSPGKTMSLLPTSTRSTSPLAKPVTDASAFQKPQDPTSEVLNAGTPKSTSQIPGYTGHVPKNMRNIRKAEHAFGAQAHPVVNDLILTSSNMGCTLNYTGYVSKYTATFGDRTTACDPRTSNGAAFGPVRCML